MSERDAKPTEPPTDVDAIVESPTTDAIDRSEEPPVVARLVIEIRSDGTRTIARGAAEDAMLGEKVAIHVEGTTPMQLALSLAKNLVSLPMMAASTFRAFLPGKKPKK